MKPAVDKEVILTALQKARVAAPPVAPSARRTELLPEIGRLLREQDAVIIAHYYTDPALQDLADSTGGYVADSLEMARFGHEHPAKTLIVAGVRFMGETAKILNPEKRVLMIANDAECSLDLGCPIEPFEKFCNAHSDRTVVVYANTSAAVKARADWVVTSSVAVPIMRELAQRGEKILWAPDKYLGDYVQKQSGADVLLWEGSCVVHEEFKSKGVMQLKKKYPEAAVLVHPESPAEVIAQADVVGSTTALIKAVRELDKKTFIVATDRGIFHKMKQAAPDKIIYEAPTAGQGATCISCAHCPWMALNSIERLYQILKLGGNEVFIYDALCTRAAKPIQRMLDFAAEHGIGQIRGNA